MKVLASKQANIINSAPNSVASPSFANNPANPNLPANTTQLTAPVNPNNAPTVIYVDADANKPVPPWVRLLGLTLATAGVASGIFLGARHFENRKIGFENRKIGNAIKSHIEKYTSPNNLHLENSIKPRHEIYKLCQELLKRPDISENSKNKIKTLLATLGIDHTNGNIKETHFVSEDGDHYIDGLKYSDIQMAAVNLKDLFSLGSAELTESSTETWDTGKLFRVANKRTKLKIQEELENLTLNHKNTDIPDYESNNPHLVLKVLVNANPEGEIQVLNPKNNEPFTKEGTDFSNHRFTSLIPQATTTPYYGNSWLRFFLLETELEVGLGLLGLAIH